MKRRADAFPFMLALTLLLAIAPVALAQPRPTGKGPIGYWVALDSNAVFDEATLRTVAERAGIVVLNAQLEAAPERYPYTALVKRLHELQPGLPVLLYTWANSWRKGGRIASDAMAGYDELGPLLIKDPRGRGEPGVSGTGRVVFGDLRQERYRDWVVAQLDKTVRATGVDGVALDLAIRTPQVRPKLLADHCKRDRDFCPAYARGMDALFTSLKSRMKFAMFNGLWNEEREPGLLADQKRLLSVADGAAIEFFGLDPQEPRTPSFEQGILVYVDAMRTAPAGKTIMVYARGPWRYTDYLEDYHWQRYLYASYLLGAGPNTLYKFHTTFQVPTQHGRTGGFDIYGDVDFDLGAPRGAYQKERGLYTRTFERGLVAVAPHDGPERQLTLPQPMFTPEGERMEGTIRVRPGQGLLLRRTASAVADKVRRNFDNPQHPAAKSANAEMRSENGARFIRLPKLPDVQVWEHDVVLEETRVVPSKPVFRARLRTTDPAARLLLVAEVDDRQKQHMEAVFDVSREGGSAGTLGKDLIFRRSRRGGQEMQVPYFPARLGAAGEAGWQSIELRADTLLGAGGRYTFRRWRFARVVGTVDLDFVEVAQGGS